MKSMPRISSDQNLAYMMLPYLKCFYFKTITHALWHFPTSQTSTNGEWANQVLPTEIADMLHSTNMDTTLRNVGRVW